tara:strand:+ start:490 stop:669 length:180 start_codon:yes stop_codon:yes gene_type:complete
MKIELTKNEKEYLFHHLVEGHLDDLNKDLRRHQDSLSISKEIKTLKSVINKLKLTEEKE